MNMHLFSDRIVTNSEGVFTPPLSLAWILALVGASGAATLALLHYLGKPWPPQLIFAGVFAAVLLARAFFEYRRWGALGRPKVGCVRGELVFTSNTGAPRELRITRSEISKIVVYGPAHPRIYRLLKHDGGYLEVQPLWSRGVESAAIAFLQQALPGDVIVEEPQTAFAHARREGPYYGSGDAS